MFTNNYIAFRKQAFLKQDKQTYVHTAGSTFDGYVNCIHHYDIGGHLKSGQCRAIRTTQLSFRNPTNNPGVYFGSGSTPANKEDFTLENPITSGLSITNPTDLVWADDGNGKHEVLADFILRNTTEAEINIYEIGVFTPICSYSYCYENNDSNTWWLAMMERTVLTEPVTIPAGEAKLVSYKLTFNQLA